MYVVHNSLIRTKMMFSVFRGLQKNDSSTLGVDAHFCFFETNTKINFSVFKNILIRVDWAKNHRFHCTKLPFMRERKAKTEKKISVFKK